MGLFMNRVICTSLNITCAFTLTFLVMKRRYVAYLNSPCCWWYHSVVHLTFYRVNTFYCFLTALLEEFGCSITLVRFSLKITQTSMWQKVIPLKDVTCVRKARTVSVFPNAIEIVSWGKKVLLCNWLVKLDTGLRHFCVRLLLASCPSCSFNWFTYPWCLFL